jgi:hypothetical protein
MMTQNPRKPNLQSESIFNDVAEVDLAVESAKKMVGAATMSLDSNMLQHAKQAIADAKQALMRVKNQTQHTEDFVLQRCEKELANAEQQLTEAMQ